ncbi:MAG: S-methyl-5-thioribulose 1-phosphate isomerase [Acidimicrobiaceae bacterium]|jgi:ribulose-bisphosphate carboxylase large chain|nr:S-methyl-5-thioribulose 1-phosphate isomerase [Acidimicrobiaceae bacterium]MDQ1420934.1 S-methyl-5-thioribulose 1-phosphate isomerase [Acidimicrobiaceae bacterium]MDQ1440555.1 S-methyl-5-thioribulose 1-phosphate isomerase [Acidimicrobiaceae bacterium]
MTDWLRVTYRVRASSDHIEGRARSIALEQSVEMGIDAVTDPWVLEHVVGRVEEITEEADHSYGVVIGLSAITVGGNSAQLLSMLFGNVSLQGDIDLVDVELPSSILDGFGGPNHGISGLRRLTAAPERPLTCSALKPQGAPTAALAELCRQLAGAGIDIVKDDHGLADQDTSPFDERVKACQGAVLSSGTGALYAPSIVGTPRQVAQRLEVVAGEGVRVVLIAPMVYGLPAFGELTMDHPDIAFLAHPAFAGTGRIAPALLFGKLFRLYGADSVIYPNYGGRFAYTPTECTAIARGARGSWHTFRPALPVPAGGMSVERVGEIVEFYGPDVMLLISGDLLASPNVARQAERFVQAVKS